MSKNDEKQENRDHLAFATFILSVAGLLITGMISGTNIYISSLQKDKELAIQQLKNKSDQKLARGKLVFTNIKQLNSTNPDDKKLAISALIWTLGREDADKLFSSIELFGPSNIQEDAESARIKIQDVNLARESKFRAWNGKWRITLTTSSPGRYAGSMILRTKKSGIVLGEFSIIDISIKGSLEGNLSEDGAILSGSLRINDRQKGSFYFILVRKGDAFEFQGQYSMSDMPKKDSRIIVKGIKAKERYPAAKK